MGLAAHDLPDHLYLHDARDGGHQAAFKKMAGLF
jgi:hypothetical protein